MKFFKRTLLLLTAFALLFSLTSCSGAPKHYTDSNGTEYLVVRDENDNIVINDSGKLQVYTLNENGKKQKSDSGEYITQYIDFNGQVFENSKVETAEMRFTIPDNFEETKDIPGYFSFESYDAEIFINYYNSDITSAISSTETNCENLLESYGSEAFSYEKYTVSVADVECTVYKQACISSEYYRNAYFYYIPYDGGYYCINCIINSDYAKKINFDKFVRTIELKK